MSLMDDIKSHGYLKLARHPPVPLLSLVDIFYNCVNVGKHVSIFRFDFFAIDPPPLLS